ncbi:CRE-NPR-15 protein [Aphelenchoides avenae]|nr:CRE-NPR-15 protein [Aphelenchus avenae]
MGDSKRFATVIYYSLLVQIIVVLLMDCYVAYTRVTRPVLPSAIVDHYLSGVFILHVGYTANAFVMVGVVGSKKMRASPVNMLLFNLAMSDFTYIVSNDRIGIHDWPPWMLNRAWPLPGWVCPINRYISSAAFMASIMNFVAIAIERYVVTVRPLQARSLCSRSQLFYWVLAIWIFAFVFEFPSYVAYDAYDAAVYYRETFNWTINVLNQNRTVSHELVEGESQICLNPSRNAPLWKVFKWAEFCTSYIFPIVVAVALYPRTCRAVWALDPGVQGKSVKVVTGSKVLGDEFRPSDSYDQDRRQIVKMLIVCVIAFFVCYTPLVVIFVRSALLSTVEADRFEKEFIDVASDLVQFICAFNPFIYTLFSTAFRQRVKEIVTCQQSIDVFLSLLFLIGLYVTMNAR